MTITKITTMIGRETTMTPYTLTKLRKALHVTGLGPTYLWERSRVELETHMREVLTGDQRARVCAAIAEQRP